MSHGTKSLRKSAARPAVGSGGMVRRIYCRYCGAKLRTDPVGLYCPTDNCQWRYGLPSDEPGALRPEKPTLAEARKVKCRTKNKLFREALAIAHRPPNAKLSDAQRSV